MGRSANKVIRGCHEVLAQIKRSVDELAQPKQPETAALMLRVDELPAGIRRTFIAQAGARQSPVHASRFAQSRVSGESKSAAEPGAKH